MTRSELAVMDGGKCIFMLRGVRPFLSDKYNFLTGTKLQIHGRRRP